MKEAHFAEDYRTLVDRLLEQMPEEEAMARAVGSTSADFQHFGYKEGRALIQFGLQPTDSIVDIGCGSGRLAAGLQPHHKGYFVGFDIAEKLVEYAKRRFGGDNYFFFRCEGLDIPVGDEETDFVTFFSVFTHLHHEESFLYLKEAIRVLRPGGTIVCTYLDMEQQFDIFEQTAEARRIKTLPHANIFMSRRMMARMVKEAGFEIVSMFGPTDQFIHLPETVEFAGVKPLKAGGYALGQGVCVARKPALRDDGPPRGSREV